MSQQQVPARRRTIDDDIVELLRDEGPLIAQDVRTRLSVASQSRFDVALLFLIEEGIVERISCGMASGLRIVGDPRPVPEVSTNRGRSVSRSHS